MYFKYNLLYLYFPRNKRLNVYLIILFFQELYIFWDKYDLINKKLAANI